MLFRTGQEVICINDDFSWAKKKYPHTKITWPKFGGVYVIRSYVCLGKKPAVVLREIFNPSVIYNDGVLREAGFWEGRFVGRSPDAHIRQVEAGKMKLEKA